MVLVKLTERSREVERRKNQQQQTCTQDHVWNCRAALIMSLER